MTVGLQPQPLGSFRQLGKAIRGEFPVFEGWKERTGRDLHYLDSAASSQKPRAVLDRLNAYLSFEHANVHRGAYLLSADATDAYEGTRETVRRFIGAQAPEEIVFTRGTTESINLVAHAAEHLFSEGDVILLTLLEHHSNIVPWQLLAARKKLRLEFVGIKDDASLDLDDFRRKLKQFQPKLVAMTQVSNAFGTVVPVEILTTEAKAAGAMVLVDAAQSVVHQALDFRTLGADFAAFSAHKLYGPTGAGVLVGRLDLLQRLEPFQGGGDMIRSVSVQGSTWADPPHRFEAGTPSIAEVIGMGEAIKFIEAIGLQLIGAHEKHLFERCLELLRAENGVEVYGPALSGGRQTSIISFNVQGVHAHDFATVADQFSVQVRAGHHCAMPAMQRLGLQSTARVSLGMYADMEDFEALLGAIRHARKMFV